MFTGPELGAAIEQARLKKRVTKRALALHFGVQPPSVQDWVRRGTIAKDKLPELWAYFNDVAGPEHWGLDRFPRESQLPAQATAPADATADVNVGNPPELDQALPVVLEALGGLTDGQWRMVRARLDDMAGHPEMRDDVAGDVLPLLAPAGRQANSR